MHIFLWFVSVIIATKWFDAPRIVSEHQKKMKTIQTLTQTSNWLILKGRRKGWTELIMELREDRKHILILCMLLWVSC